MNIDLFRSRGPKPPDYKNLKTVTSGKEQRCGASGSRSLGVAHGTAAEPGLGQRAGGRTPSMSN
jgi:hypothetical protein